MPHKIISPLLHTLDKKGLVPGVSLNMNDPNGHLLCLDMCRSTTYVLKNGNWKEVNKSLIQYSLSKSDPFPVMQFEVAVSQGNPTLGMDACEWLAGLDGGIKSVSTLNVDLAEELCTIKASVNHREFPFGNRVAKNINFSVWALKHVEVDPVNITHEMPRQQPFPTLDDQTCPPNWYWWIDEEKAEERDLSPGGKRNPFTPAYQLLNVSNNTL